MTKRIALTILAAAVAGAVLVVSVVKSTTTSPAAAMSANVTLSLPRIPWEGGPAYWDQFPAAKTAGWANPKFFPIVMWFDSVSSNAEVRADRSYGINTYIGEPVTTKYSYFASDHSYVLNTLNGGPGSASVQPGIFLSDEPDGKGGSSAAALKNIDDIVAAAPNDGKFREINFSDTLINGSDAPVNKAHFQDMVSSYAGPASVDKYYYTQPNCDDIRYLIVSISAGHCRTASSYGATVRALRMRMAATGHLKPVWNFVEDLSGAPDAYHFYAYLKPGQLAGAVMDSIINEARGILYFNQSFAGSCVGSNVIREVQDGRLPCAKPQLAAMKQVDQRIEALAPVINTQSYRYTFGSGLDTMLKAYQGSAYIFAMISGAASSQPGERTFALPPGLAGATSVKVLNENRTIPVRNGKFTDNFQYEYTYHIYKIEM